jgi:tellurite resistance protein
MIICLEIFQSFGEYAVANLLFISPIMFVSSFFYRKSNKSKFKKFKKQISIDLSTILDDLIKHYSKLDFNQFSNDNNKNEDEFLFTKIIYEKLGINEDFQNNETKQNNEKSSTDKNFQSKKQEILDVIYREDFFDICTAIFATRVALADNKLVSEEEEYLRKFFDNFDKDEFRIISLFQKEYSDEVICDIIKKRYGDNLTLYEDLINNLFGVSESDGYVSDVEVNYIKKISKLLGLTIEQFESIKNPSKRDDKLDDKNDYINENDAFEDIEDIIEDN